MGMGLRFANSISDALINWAGPKSNEMRRHLQQHLENIIIWQPHRGDAFSLADVEVHKHMGTQCAIGGILCP